MRELYNIVNGFGVVCGLFGAILNALGLAVFAFPIWAASSAALAFYFWQVHKGTWILNSGALLQCGLQIMYLGTNILGTVRVFG